MRRWSIVAALAGMLIAGWAGSSVAERACAASASHCAKVKGASTSGCPYSGSATGSANCGSRAQDAGGKI